MRKRDEKSLRRLLGKAEVLYRDKARCVVEVGTKPVRVELVHTAARLILYARTPMGFQVTVLRYKDVERISSGKKKGTPFVQFLGETSRVLLLFKTKEARNRYRTLCVERVQAIRPNSRDTHTACP